MYQHNIQVSIQCLGDDFPHRHGATGNGKYERMLPAIRAQFLR
jgi:hypothetical protein